MLHKVQLRSFSVVGFGFMRTKVLVVSSAVVPEISVRLTVYMYVYACMTRRRCITGHPRTYS